MSRNSYFYLNFIRHINVTRFAILLCVGRLRASRIVFFVRTKGRYNPLARLLLATHLYERYLATDDLSEFRRALEVLDRIAIPDNPRNQTVVQLRVRGWAAIPDQRIKKIIFTGKGFNVVEKLKLNRMDVAEAYANPRMSKSGFDVLLPIANLAELIKVEIRTRKDQNYYLNLPALPESELFIFQKLSEIQECHHAGSIDDLSILISSISPNELKWVRQLQSYGLNVVVLIEFLSITGHKFLAKTILESFIDLPYGHDIQIDRLRFALDITPYNTDSKSVQSRSFGSIEDSTVIRIENVIVHNNSIIQEHDGTLISNDLAARPEFDFVSGQHHYIIGSSLKLGQASIMNPGAVTREISTAVSLLGRNSSNYFHSLVEYLPLIRSYRDSPYFSSHKFLINSSCPPTIIEALKCFLNEEQIVQVTEKDVIAINELLLASFHTFVPDSTTIGWEKSSQLRIGPINFLSDSLIAQLCVFREPTRNVMATRHGGARGILNLAELEDIAGEEGFELVDLTKLSFAEQVRLLYATKNFVVPGGSGLANQIFMQPGTTVLAMATKGQSSLGVFRAIAEQRSLRFSYILGETIVPFGSTRYMMNYLHESFIVPPKKFRKELQKMSL